MQSVEIEFEIYRRSALETMTYGLCSYFNIPTRKIGVCYHEQLTDKRLAFRILVLDVNHECLHAILMELEDAETSLQYDRIAQNLELDKDEITRINKAFEDARQQC